jgi:hypothetical protein
MLSDLQPPIVLGFTIFCIRCRFSGQLLGQWTYAQWRWQCAHRMPRSRRQVIHSIIAYPNFTELRAFSVTSTTASHGKAMGAGIGGAVAGALLGILASIFYFRRRNRKPSYNKFSGLGKPSATTEDQPGDQAKLVGHGTVSGSVLARLPSEGRDTTRASGISSSNTSGTTPLPFYRLGQTDQQFHVEPFALSSPAPHQPPCSPPEASIPPTSNQQAGASDTAPLCHPQSSSSASAPVPQGQEHAPGSQVYVVHHDGGRPPVTVYTPGGTEVVELPPRYADSRDPPQPRRLPAVVARKSSQSEATSNS